MPFDVKEEVRKAFPCTCAQHDVDKGRHDLDNECYHRPSIEYLIERAIKATEDGRKFMVWKSSGAGWCIAWDEHHTASITPELPESIAYYAAAIGVPEDEIRAALIQAEEQR
jgi:hypothetical protein